MRSPWKRRMIESSSPKTFQKARDQRTGCCRDGGYFGRRVRVGEKGAKRRVMEGNGQRGRSRERADNDAGGQRVHGAPILDLRGTAARRIQIAFAPGVRP